MAFNIVIPNIEQYANLAAFPVSGESNILYIDEALSASYFWTGAAYSTLSGGGGSGEFPGLITLENSGKIGPISSGSDIDDFTDANLSTGNYLQIEPTNDIELTGITAPAAGVNQLLYISNVSTSKKLKLKNNNSGSAAANRFLLKSDIIIEKNMGGILIYNHTANRWNYLTKHN
jgi:hypothetical protein